MGVKLLHAGVRVGVVSQLINPVARVEFGKKNREDQEKLRVAHAAHEHPAARVSTQRMSHQR